MTIAAILGHQGGWDEIALVAGPIAVIVFLLVLAEKRAARHRALEGTQSDEGSSQLDDTAAEDIT